MREERLAGRNVVARRRRLDRQALVRRDVLHETEELRCERRLRQGLGAVLRHASRQLDDVVVGETRDRAVVADVDDVHRAVAGRERPYETDAASL